MRIIVLSSLVAFAALLGEVAPVAAQGNPNADQMIRALSPQVRLRGIRPSTPQAGQQPIAVAPNPSAVVAPNPAAVAPPKEQTAAAGAPVRPANQQAAAPSVDLTVEFLSGSADLTPAAMRTLDELAVALNNAALASFRFRIEGHTDTVGSRATNLLLSQQRAASAADYLQRRHNVAASRLETRGRGQEALKVPTGDQVNEPRNRRVQVINIGA